MKIKCTDVLLTLALNIIHAVYSEHILSCNITSIVDTCLGDNQICNGTSNQCDCLPGYVMVDDECVDSTVENSTSHTATVAVITIFTLALLAVGLVLVVRKYNIVEYVRQKINLRRNTDVQYEDVMIGQDDPPLSP